MNVSYIELSPAQVGLAAVLMLLNGLISLILNLNMLRQWFIATFRTIVQLTLVGFILQWVFHVQQWYWVLVMMVVMTLVAAHTAAGRSQRRYRGLYLNTILSIWISAWLTTSYGLLVILRAEGNWFQPQYAIPLLGMVLGNTLNGISLGLNTFTHSLVHQRDEVEGLLALGATRWEAALAPIRHAIRTGMIPIMNSMMVVGIVSLPGMMTGQLISGTAPLHAVQYQIVIMFLIASATALGTVGVVLLTYYRMFNHDHQFLSERLN